MSLPHLLFDRSIGCCPGRMFERTVKLERIQNIRLSSSRVFEWQRNCPVSVLDIDKIVGRFLLSGGADGTISLFDLGSLKSPIRPRRVVKKRGRQERTTTTNQGHSNGVTGLIWYPNDNALFLSSSFDETVRVWDANQMACAFHFNLHSKVYSIAMAESSHTLTAVASQDKTIRLCDLSTGTSTQSLLGHKSSTVCTQWSPSNPFHLASGDRQGVVLLWDIRRADSILLRFDRLRQSSTISPRVVKAPSSFQYSPSPKKKKEEFGMFGKKSQKTLTARAHDATVNSLLFSRDGCALLSSGLDGEIHLWDTQNGLELPSSYGKTKNTIPRSLKLSLGGDGSLVAIPNSNQIDFYHFMTGDCIGTLYGHLDTVNAAICHPFTDDLYSCGNDHQILAWSSNSVCSRVDDQFGEWVREDKEDWSDGSDEENEVEKKK